MIGILDAGPLTTVQDLGRFGQLRYGIPQSGAMDRFALVVANRLVGNADGAAALESTLIGPRFEADASYAIAVTGADAGVTVNGDTAPLWSTIFLNAGDVVKIGAARSGVRNYVAFRGGIDVPLILGSRSTYVRGGLGGHEGRALRRGDRLRILGGASPRAWALARDLIPGYDDEPLIRVVLGPQADRFSADGLATLLETSYRLSPQSDRMGARLVGGRIEHAPESGGSLALAGSWPSPTPGATGVSLPVRPGGEVAARRRSGRQVNPFPV